MIAFIVILYLGSIILSNLLVTWFGIINIGILSFPAGAITIGLTFSFRDYLQKEVGKINCLWWMLLATVLTLLFNVNIAIASAASFIVSELIDWLIFTYSKGSFKLRLVKSNLTSIPIDSILFVFIAFGIYWPAIIGQIIIKWLCSFVVLIIPTK